MSARRKISTSSTLVIGAVVSFLLAAWGTGELLRR